MRSQYFIMVAALASMFVSCGGTYVDDKRNFERAFQTKCPTNIEVVHSVYSKTPHFTEEHEYYFQIKPAAGSEIFNWLTGGPGILQPTDGLAQVPFYLNLRSDRPKWFAPDTLTNYDIWYSTNTAFIILRAKEKAEIFVYGSVGM